MNQIKHFNLTPLEEGKFIKTALATYEQNNIKKTWEVIHAHDSVAILLYDKEKNAFILVKQFRPAVYMTNKNGLTVELCAGIVDKEASLVQIAKEEIEEECGYDVPIERISKITSIYSSVGFAGAKQTLYYAEVSEAMRVSEGGGIEGEQIEVIFLPLKEVKKFMYDESIAKTTGIMFAFMWWFEEFS